jgi:hypothetical protein
MGVCADQCAHIRHEQRSPGDRDRLALGSGTPTAGEASWTISTDVYVSGGDWKDRDTMKTNPSAQNASAVIVVLALLGILSLYLLVNARTLARLKHDVKRIELRHWQRLNSPLPLATNRPLPSPTTAAASTNKISPP